MTFDLGDFNRTGDAQLCGGKPNKGRGKLSGGYGALGGQPPEPGDALDYFSPAPNQFSPEF